MIPGRMIESRVMVLIRQRYVTPLLCSLQPHYFDRWRKRVLCSLHRRLATIREPASIVVYLSAVGTRMMTLCKSFGLRLIPRSAKSVQRRAPKACKKVKSSLSVLFGSFRPQAEVENTDCTVDDSTKIACRLKATSTCSL